MMFPVWYLYVLAGGALALAIAGLALGAKRKAARNACIGVGVLGLFAAIFLFISTARAWVFTGGPGDVEYRRLAVYGVPHVAHVNAEVADPSQTRQWIVNQTMGVELQVVTIYYESNRGERTLAALGGLGDGHGPLIVAPNTAQTFDDDVDYVGPDAAIPKERTGQDDIESRVWVTW
jgi:hypothetical protein